MYDLGKRRFRKWMKLQNDDITMQHFSSISGKVELYVIQFCGPFDSKF